MAKHTPGPWVQTAGGWIEGPNFQPVVDYEGCGSHHAFWENDADLKLVLAAPELLEACLLARHVCEDGNALQQQIDAAIRKATQ